MEIGTIFSKRRIKIIGYFISTIFSVLFIREIYHYFSLPNSDDVPEIISLFKYQENAIIQGYLWILLALFGVGLIRQNFFGWLIPQSILLIGLDFFILLIFSAEVSDIRIGLIFIWVLYTLFCFIVFRFFIKGKPKYFFNVTIKMMPYYYGIAISLSAIYWILDYTIWEIISL